MCQSPGDHCWDRTFGWQAEVSPGLSTPAKLEFLNHFSLLNQVPFRHLAPCTTMASAWQRSNPRSPPPWRPVSARIKGPSLALPGVRGQGPVTVSCIGNHTQLGPIKLLFRYILNTAILYIHLGLSLQIFELSLPIHPTSHTPEVLNTNDAFLWKVQYGSKPSKYK